MKKFKLSLFLVLSVLFLFGQNEQQLKEKERERISQELQEKSDSFKEGTVVKKEKKKHGHLVTVTRYNPTREQCGSNSLVTADNSKINLEKLRKGIIRWVAVSRDLRRKFKYGDTIYIDSDDDNIRGHYEVHDTMHPRHTNRIDILTAVSADHGQGIWHGVKITKG